MAIAKELLEILVCPVSHAPPGRRVSGGVRVPGVFTPG